MTGQSRRAYGRGTGLGIRQPRLSHLPRLPFPFSFKVRDKVRIMDEQQAARPLLCKNGLEIFWGAVRDDDRQYLVHKEFECFVNSPTVFSLRLGKTEAILIVMPDCPKPAPTSVIDSEIPIIMIWPRPKRGAPRRNKARDNWIRRQRQKQLTLKQILDELSQIYQDKGWEPVTTDVRIHQICNERPKAKKLN